MEYTRPEFNEVKRGEIYYIEVDDNSECVGSEQCNHDRPGIIVSNDVGNTHSGIVEVVYLTTQPKKNLPTHVDIYTTTKQSTALCEQICTVSKFRLRRYVNQCTEREMEEIDNALQVSLQLSKAKGIVKYMEKWDKMMHEAKDKEVHCVEQAEEVVEPITEEMVEPVVEPIVEHIDNTVYEERIASLEAQLEIYNRMYEDMRDLLRLSIGGNSQ